MTSILANCTMGYTIISHVSSPEFLTRWVDVPTVMSQRDHVMKYEPHPPLMLIAQTVFVPVHDHVMLLILVLWVVIAVNY